VNALELRSAVLLRLDSRVSPVAVVTAALLRVLGQRHTHRGCHCARRSK
jgi:hypothetical protein